MLPSRKILPILAICVVVLGIVSLTAFYNPKANAGPQTSADVTIVNPARKNSVSQEIYQQVESELNQLATSSAETTSSTTPSENTLENGAITASTTATAVLAQDFLNEYLAMKQSGQTISPTDEDSMIQNLISTGRVGNYIPQATIYTQSDIRITSDTSSAALHAYGNSIGAVFQKNTVPKNLNELDILQTAVNSSNPQDLANLAIIVASYRGIVNGIISTPVPPEAVGVDVDLLNDFSQAENSVEDMQKLFTDPIVAVTGVENYQTISENSYNDISALGPFFQKYGVVFAATEPGAVLVPNQ